MSETDIGEVADSWGWKLIGACAVYEGDRGAAGGFWHGGTIWEGME